MYGKIFEQIYDSSICDDWKALIVFQQMIILSDDEGFIDMTHEAISRRTNIPLDIIKYGIKKLEDPDLRSRNSNFDGRRIMRLDDHRDWGWKVINKIFYKNLASREEKKRQDRDRINRKRKMTKENINDSNDVASCRKESQSVADVAHTDTYTNTNKKKERKKNSKKNFSIPTLQEIKDYCTERKNQIDPEQFFDFYESNGWVVGKSKMKNWKASVRTWEKRNFDNGNKKKTRTLEDLFE